MSLEVTLAVLGAALAHAVWNAMVKSSRDVLLDMAVVAVGGGVASLVALLFVAAPGRASWPYLAASVAVHIGYYFAVAGAYRAGDLSHGYPLMRGIAPLLVSVTAIVWFGEIPTPSVWLGVLLICGGVLSLGCAGLRWGPSVAWALANAAIIATYTLIDAAGVRSSGSPEGYALWLLALNGVPFPLIVLLMRRDSLLPYARRSWLRGLFAGSLSVVGYGISLWAMARAPVAAVAALRETSVIFAALIGAWLLKEGHVSRRVAGAAVVACGVVALRL
jgi:drug/metabolite transporter (DMT)-like permease